MNLTINDIRSWDPCYDPSEVLPENWQGTALDILRMEEVPAADRLWVVLREECIPARVLRLFAADCARRSLARVENPDPASLAACDVAERFANGQATEEELYAARSAASSAYYAADDAATAAHATAAYYAAAYYAAAESSATATTLASAATAAAESAEYADDAADFYSAEAAAAERDAQVAKLIELIQEDREAQVADMDEKPTSSPNA